MLDARARILPMMALAAWLAISPNSNAADKAKTGAGIVKWVDEKGVTHYGDSLPAQYSDRDNSVINSQGITIRRNRVTPGSNTVEDRATLEQQRRDRALLATFTTAEEIDFARDRNLQMDKSALHGLQQHLDNAKEHLADNRKHAESYLKRKQAVPADLSNDIKSNQDDIVSIEAQIAERRKSMEATQKRFSEDKRRFSELKSSTTKPDVVGR